MNRAYKTHCTGAKKTEWLANIDFGASVLMTRIFVGLLLLSLSACGFHLRGNVVMPASLSSIYVEDAHASRITPVLQQLLRSNDVELAPDAASAKAVLVINGERFERRVLSVGGTGKAQEFALQYTVQFSLLDQSQQIMLGQQHIQLERDLRFDETAVLAMSSQEAQRNQDMLQDAAQQILRRIQSVNVKN